MKTDISKLLQMKQFFKVLQSKVKTVKFSLKQPSQLLMKNIHADWLQYNHTKSTKHNMPIFIDQSNCTLEHTPAVFGTIEQHVQQYNAYTTLELCNGDTAPLKKSELMLHITVPKQDSLLYFFQWQRYRKYWWSSISTTPSLFSLNEYRNENNVTHVDIVAQFPCGTHPVETLSYYNDESEKTCHVTCLMCLEEALFALLLDGLSTSTELDYLRLHRKIAPYKISFALDLKDDSPNTFTLTKLATHLQNKLESKKISTWLPDFSLPLEKQINENVRMGVTYTAILDENTLKLGLFKLLDSGTKLTEQVHVADFHKYAALIFKNRLEPTSKFKKI